MVPRYSPVGPVYARLPLPTRFPEEPFFLQRRGSAGVGTLFGPVIVVWFATLAILGLRAIIHHPQVLGAINPVYAATFLADNGWTGFVTLSAVFLAVTGGEALYADLGHFGRRPIQILWFTLVLPALLLNYFGQGAALLADPRHSYHPFYALAPGWMLYPLVLLATLATITASQAAITGAFSLTSQAIQLRLLPPMRVLQTSETRGQIYVPIINWLLMFAAIGLVLGFHSSSGLAAAYGISVNFTMTITTVLAFNISLEYSHWGWPRSLLFLVGFLSVDLAFLGANFTKIAHGGWFPIGVGLLFFTVISTWRRGSALLMEELVRRADPLPTLLGELVHQPPMRVPGTGVFITPWLEQAPPTLKHHLRRNKVLPEQLVLLNVVTQEVPKVPADERIEIECYAQGFCRVTLNYGFLQRPNVPSDLAACKDHGLAIDLDDATYYIGHQSVLPKEGPHAMARWREALFAFLARNATHATMLYHLPAERVVEMGFQVRL